MELIPGVAGVQMLVEGIQKLLRTVRIADPGAKTEAGRPVGRPSSFGLRDWQQGDESLGARRRASRLVDGEERTRRHHAGYERELRGPRGVTLHAVHAHEHARCMAGDIARKKRAPLRQCLDTIVSHLGGALA